MARFCSIVPPHVLKHIIDSPLTSPRTLLAAQKTYDHVCRIHESRVLGAYMHDDEPDDLATETRSTTRKVYRKIYTSEGTNEMGKKLLFEERYMIPLRTMDWDARNVHEYFGKIYEFYDKPGPPGFNNAFWNGREISFGDGDGDLFTNFTDKIDIIAHELTHGVIQLTADLKYHFQSGALNESISDVFASMAKQYDSETLAKDADWLIGEKIFDPFMENVWALRSLKNPGSAYDHKKIGKDPQPATMDGYQDLEEENDGGGVHINSGIPNHAFYLASVALGGYSWEKAGKIWYAALTDRALRSVDSNEAFKVFADLTIKHAGDFDEDTREKVKKAWIDVKVLNGKDEL
ncbi:0e315afa-a40b-46f6-a4e7-968684a287d9 [Sclerotinia trifoliorum]|uniref:0e315afa-a40b-46f6-a4e7-968684a287d9 n=1 Tax=Sclerotinia trifoliorum TaxID=28548 RepID=A0A8H2VWI0_9HELO|nr:0e315afa-a40b-46f6-a4e7-968684a287d9 [Sclerotinia trifoliorum]